MSGTKLPPMQRRARRVDGRSIRIALLALPGITAGALAGLQDVLRAAGRSFEALTGESTTDPLFEPVVVAPSTGPVRASSGLTIVPDVAIADAGPFDIVCVPNLVLPLDGDPLAAGYGEAADWLRARYDDGALLCSACSGSLVLAATGLLDGREATTHWGYVDVFRARFPAVRLVPERVLVVSGPQGRIVTAGGGSSWNDLALYLIARYGDGETAVRVAKVYLLTWHAEGQSAYAAMTRELQHNDAVIRRAQRWLAEHFAERNPVATATARSALAERTFKRRFVAGTGMSPIAYVQSIRLEHAKALLEQSKEPVDAIAARVGYDDPTFFRRLFRRHAGITAADYRRRFGSTRNTARVGA